MKQQKNFDFHRELCIINRNANEILKYQVKKGGKFREIQNKNHIYSYFNITLAQLRQNQERTKDALNGKDKIKK